MTGFEDAIRLPLGQWVATFIGFLQHSLTGLFDVVAAVFSAIFDAVAWMFTTPPDWTVILVLAALAGAVKGWRLALGTTLGLVLVIAVDQWDNAMHTLSLTLVAVLIATAISVPLGIWAARSPAVSGILRPVLDFLQTMPAFVYLLPAIFLFGVGVVPGIVATILFALAPGVRMTELGIRGVDTEVVEAGHAFGATPGRILRQIQLPLAMPSIMAGVNQVIMLSLSMSVIASMVGAPGLGTDIIQALSSVDIALGFEAGLAVVVIAMVLDRITGAFAQPRPARRRAVVPVVAAGSALTLVLAGCVGGIGAAAADDGGRHVRIGVFNGWPEGEAVSYVWKVALEKKGYHVDLDYADAGSVFAGVAGGDYDFALDGWLPYTHADYFEKFGDDIVDLGSWNDDAKLTVAVNADAPIDSLTELAGSADAFGNRIVGIEPGAGLTAAVQDKTIPTYGLDGMDFVTSSTPAMLAELSGSLDAGENIAVTLWRPHWAYDAFDIKDLDDPEGTLGKAESIHTFTRGDFGDDLADVNGWLSHFRMDSDLLFSLEDAMFNTDEHITDYSGVVGDWLDAHGEWAKGLTS